MAMSTYRAVVASYFGNIYHAPAQPLKLMPLSLTAAPRPDTLPSSFPCAFGPRPFGRSFGRPLWESCLESFCLFGDENELALLSDTSSVSPWDEFDSSPDVVFVLGNV